MNKEEFKEVLKQDSPKCWYVKGAYLYFVRIRPLSYNSKDIESFGYYQIIDLFNDVIDTFPRRPTKYSGEILKNLFTSKIEALEVQIKNLESMIEKAKEEKIKILKEALERKV